jgi:hypothetical protein
MALSLRQQGISSFYRGGVCGRAEKRQDKER